MPSVRRPASKAAGKSRSSSNSSSSNNNSSSSSNSSNSSRRDRTYQVRDIRGYRVENKVEKFFVLWLDYADDESTWEPWSSLSELGGDLRKKMESLRDRYNESLKRIASLRESLATAREEAALAARSLTEFVLHPADSSKPSSSSSSSSSVTKCSTSSSNSRMCLHVSPPANRGDSSSSTGDSSGPSPAAAASAAAAAASPEQDPAAAGVAAAAGARARKEWLQRLGLSRIATRNLRCYALNVERCVCDHRAFFESPEETLGLPPQRQQQKRSSTSSSSSGGVPLKDTGEDLRKCAVLATQDWEAFPKFDGWGTDPSGSILLKLNYLQVTFPTGPFNAALLRRALSPDTRYSLTRRALEALAEWQLCRLIGFDCMLMPADEFLSRLEGGKRMLQHWQWMRRRLLAAGLLLHFRDPVRDLALVALRATREQLEELLREMAQQRAKQKLKRVAAAARSPTDSSSSCEKKESPEGDDAVACFSTPVEQQGQQQQQRNHGASRVEQRQQQQHQVAEDEEDDLPKLVDSKVDNWKPLAVAHYCSSSSNIRQQAEQQEQDRGEGDPTVATQRKRRRRSSGATTPTAVAAGAAAAGGATAAEVIVGDEESEVLEVDSDAEREAVSWCDVAVASVWVRAEEAAVAHALEVVRLAEDTARQFVQSEQGQGSAAAPQDQSN
ncbi:hypothetical protein Esti_005665 [Eimeria stiedai]